MVIKASRNAQHLNPADYPLARHRTPESLKNFRFNVGDQTAVFREADNAANTFDEVR